MSVDIVERVSPCVCALVQSVANIWNSANKKNVLCMVSRKDLFYNQLMKYLEWCGAVDPVCFYDEDEATLANLHSDIVIVIRDDGNEEWGFDPSRNAPVDVVFSDEFDAALPRYDCDRFSISSYNTLQN